MTPFRRWSAPGAGLAVALFANGAKAQVEPIRLDYSGAVECPAAPEFARSVFGRTTRARPADASESTARTFVVAITKSGSGFVGSLVVREADGKTTAREVTGADCKTVSEALALATSLAIDPNASLAPPSSPADTTSDGTPPSAPAEPEPAPPELRGPDAFISKAPPHEWNTTAALGPSAATGIGPRLALGGSLSAARSRRTPDRALSSFGVELAVLGTLSDSVSTASSRFWFAFVRPELCTMGLTFAARAALVPCLGLELGTVTGVGSDIADAATRTRFWAAADAKLALRVDLSEHYWFVEANGGVVAPFVRYDFVFRDPDTDVHAIPALGATFGAKLGRRFF
ncbi:MAG TPA: hypothetical protein VFZ53_10585 [Polyangiaceae bacterium]